MRLNDAGIGKHLEQRIEMSHAAGVLQQPALSGRVGADQAQILGIATVARALTQRS